MDRLRRYLIMLLLWINSWLKYVLKRLYGGFLATIGWMASPDARSKGAQKNKSEEWETSEALRTYGHGDGHGIMVTIQTSTHAFLVSI